MTNTSKKRVYVDKYVDNMWIICGKHVDNLKKTQFYVENLVDIRLHKIHVEII